MKRYLFFTLAVIFALKYGYTYITSEEFQKYGDKTKAPWTCQANNYLARYYRVVDDGQRAQEVYSRVIKRCPKTPFAEEAAFGIAEAYDEMYLTRQAMEAYSQFIEQYKTSPLKNRAIKALSRINTTRF
jgi:TolA-binding protein